MNIELLSNYDLIKFCKLLKIPLVDVVNKDLLNNMTPKIGCYIINLQNHNEGDGTHWTCFIINKSVAIYYDSFGLICPVSVINFIKRFNKQMKLIYSIDAIQNIKSVACGWYVLFFLYYFNIQKNKNYSLILNYHNNLFNKNNSKLNDKILQSIIKTIFFK